MNEFEKIISENQQERERLAALTSKLTEAVFQKRLPNGWTVAAAFVHLAFWDERQTTLFKRWLEQGVQPASLDAEAINPPLEVIAKAIAGPAAVKLALEAAETVDGIIEKLSPVQVEELLKMGLERNLHRAIHRKNHLDKIEKALDPKN